MTKNKKLLSLLLSLVTVMSLSVPAFASTIPEKPKNIVVKVNGEEVQFPDAKPYSNKDDRTMVPVRFVSEQFGAKVDWDDPNLTAVICRNGITVRVPIGKDTLNVTNADGSNKTVKMDTRAELHDGRTCVPIRFVMESLDAWVGYSDMFNVCQIYADQLTPKEINRLQAYHDNSWDEELKANGDTSPVSETMHLKNFPQVANFASSGNQYGFSNANEWVLNHYGTLEAMYPKFKGTNSKLIYDANKNLKVDYAKLMLDEAITTINNASTRDKSARINFRSDLSCVYSSRNNATMACEVRGILTIAVSTDATATDLSELNKRYTYRKGFEAGKIYELDCQATVMADYTTGKVCCVRFKSL